MNALHVTDMKAVILVNNYLIPTNHLFLDY